MDLKHWRFTAGYPLMSVLAAGLLARAAIDPTQRLLKICWAEQRRCAAVYAAAFAFNLAGCIVLVRMGPQDAASAPCAADCRISVAVSGHPTPPSA